MKEVRNYVPLINKGVLSIMVAHLAVKNNEEFIRTVCLLHVLRRLSQSF